MMRKQRFVHIADDAPSLASRWAAWNERLLECPPLRRMRCLPPAWGYALGLAAGAVATALSWTMAPWAGIAAAYAISFLASAMSARLLGLAPGLLCVFYANFGIEVLILRSTPLMSSPAAALRFAAASSLGSLIALWAHGWQSPLMRARRRTAALITDILEHRHPPGEAAHSHCRRQHRAAEIRL